jgi:hypothetical protein
LKGSRLTRDRRTALPAAAFPALKHPETTSYQLVLGMILLVSALFRLRNLDTLPPFIDETASLNVTVDPGSFPELTRVILGKFLGFLLFKVIYYVCYDPLYCARLIMALTGIASAAVIAAIALKLGGRIASSVSCAVVGFSPLLVFHDRIALFDQLAFLLAGSAILLNVIASKSSRPAFTFWGALVFVLACSTKAHFLLLAPLLFLPDLDGGISWNAISRKAILVLAGFVAGAAILAILMGNVLAELNFVIRTPGGLARYAELPSQFLLLPAGSTRLQLMFSNIGYMGHVLLKYQSWSFWLLFAASALAIFGRKKSLPCVLLLAITPLVVLAMSAGLPTIFPRYLNLVMLPVALQIGLGAEQVFATRFQPSGQALIASFKANRLYALQGGLLILFGVGSFINAARNDLRIMNNQSRYSNIPGMDHFQYQASWPSGARIAETCDFIRNYCLEAGGPVVLWTSGGMRHGNATFPILLRGQGNLQFVHGIVQPDRLQRIIDSKARVLLLIEPAGFPLNEQELPKLGFTLETIYSSPPLLGGAKYQIELVRKKVAGDTR